RAWNSAVGPRFEIDAVAVLDSRRRIAAVSEALTSLDRSPRFGVLPYPANATDDRNINSATVAESEALVRYAQLVASPYFKSRIAEGLQSIRYFGVDRHFNQSAFNLFDQVPPFPTEQHGVATILAYDRNVRRAVDERCREIFGFGLSADFARGRNVD